MRLSNKPLPLLGCGSSAGSPTDDSMLGGCGASGGITGSKLGGRIETGWGAGTLYFLLHSVESIPDLGFMLVEEGGEDGSDELALIDLGSMAFQEVTVHDVEVHDQQLPAALRHGDWVGDTH